MFHNVYATDTIWSGLDEETRQQRLKKAEAKWVSTELGKTVQWSDLSQLQKIFAAQVMPMMERTESDPDAQADTVRCLDCLDRAYRIRTIGIASNATWCHCDKGLAAAAGYWLDKTHPMHPGFGRRVKSVSGQRQLEEFIVSPLSYDFEFVSRLRKRIDYLVESEQKIRRSRKAEE